MSDTSLEVQIADLDDMRTTLGAVAQFLQAEDIAQCQRLLKPKVEYSALTKEVMRIVGRVENILKDHLLTQHDQEPEYNPMIDNNELALD